MPNTLNFRARLRFRVTSTTLGNTFVEITFVYVMHFATRLIFIYSKPPLPESLAFIKLPFVHRCCMFLNSLPMFFPKRIIPNIRIPNRWILQMTLSMKQSLKKTALKGHPICPGKPSLPLLLPKMILSPINSLIIVFGSIPLRLLIFPSALVFKVGHLIGIGALVFTSTDEIACVGIHINSVFEIDSQVFLDSSFEEPMKILVVLGFINLRVPTWQVVLCLRILIHVNYIHRGFDLPHPIVSHLHLRQFVNALLHVIIGQWQRTHLLPILNSNG